VKLRVGQGFDVHRFADPAAGRPLLLMGLEIPHDRGLEGHSDADVMVHALMDALLGAAGLGDIGLHFPDTDETWRGADSTALLQRVMKELGDRGWRLLNADVLLIGERPKIGPYRQAMRERIAPFLGIDPADLNVKATTTEQLGFTGRGEGLAAQAVVLLESVSQN
jgi:2-C-methyl-D-erythritol 2,4-cyclodiphosphate synthase